MSFTVPDAHDRHIGRYSLEITPRFLDFAGVVAGPVLDVACGSGILTAALARRFGAASVSAIDPSRSLAELCCARAPLADVRVGSGEKLPFAEGAFEAALSQLALPSARDPGRFVAESRRVVRRSGVVAACTFAAGGFALAEAFWRAARRFDPGAGTSGVGAPDAARPPFASAPELRALWDGASLGDVSTAEFEVEASYADFDDLWSPLESGAGSTGSYLVAQPEERRAQIRDACAELLGAPGGELTLRARVVAIRGRA